MQKDGEMERAARCDDSSGLSPGVIVEDNSAAMVAGEIYARTANFNEIQLNYFSTDGKSFGIHNAKVRRGSGS